LVCTDASKEGINGVLIQEGHVVFYSSRKLNEHEKLICHPRFGTCSNYVSVEDVETLLARKNICLDERSL
jgi:hypothetical protein